MDKHTSNFLEGKKEVKKTHMNYLQERRKKRKGRRSRALGHPKRVRECPGETIPIVGGNIFRTRRKGGGWERLRGDWGKTVGRRCRNGKKKVVEVRRR